MLMALGMFVFEVGSVPYQKLKRATQWRHASQSRVGDRPAYQFVGPGSDTITLSGTLLPEFTGGRLDLDEIRDMADKGQAWPLVEGTGRQYGLWVITKVDETSSAFFRDGAAAKIDFTMTLEHVDDQRTDMMGDLTTSTLARIAGAYA
ncbi:phage tail protein [Chromohalobacter canadensis]|uniref:phage tail protein n=1 Tax=Chromohalobacter canadensis TaxID=141389 RepID=UPI0021BFE420|nr:phage tail protein [Chromohalobacter canadensis]MCT8469441.1 phage tail protein [Chromohalobacter canadensis]MCT8472065.1 phage tail protein [Chromohalobacter canadensis]MCT8499822.1 phage tail protein [Chromohalobacter canadensis]